jgi:hypothetical protein
MTKENRANKKKWITKGNKNINNNFLSNIISLEMKHFGGGCIWD